MNYNLMNLNLKEKLIVAKFLLKTEKISLSRLIDVLSNLKRGSIITYILSFLEMECININFDNNTIAVKKRNMKRYIKQYDNQ